MRKLFFLSGVFCLVVLMASFRLLQTSANEKKLSLATLNDKIKGAWAGQMIGVSYGAPLEFRSNGKIIENNLNQYQDWNDKRIANSLKQDDVYVDITFASVMDSLGLNASLEDYGNYFMQSKYLLFHANAQARQNLRNGIPVSLAGTPKYNIHANDIDFQIEADFIGTMAPGLPQLSNVYCERIGRIMNAGDGLYGGMFVAGMYSAAFFETDPLQVVKGGVACIPEESKYSKIIHDVIHTYQQDSSDWKKAWQVIEDKWDGKDVCPGGALQPYNIDASINGAYIAIGLLYGKGDFEQTMQIAARCGQDADCNPSSAGGILGTLLGYDKIPAKFLAGFDAIKDTKFDNTNYSFNDIVASTRQRAFQLIKLAGGSVSDSDVIIPVQQPLAPKLEQFTMGKPMKIIPANGGAWKWTGDWKTKEGVVEWYNKYKGKIATGGNDEQAQLSFTGTAVLLMGINSETGGKADVYIDGKKQGSINAYVSNDTYNDALWHTFGLQNTKHVLQVILQKQGDVRSKSNDIHILAAVIYQ